MFNYIPQIERLRRAENFFRFGTISNNKIDTNGNEHDNLGRFTRKGVAKSRKYDKIKRSKNKSIKLSKHEYARIMHELNTNLTKEELKKKQVVRNIGNYAYTIEIYGFSDYRIKYKNEIR